MVLARNLLIAIVIITAGYATVHLMDNDARPSGRPSQASSAPPTSAAQPAGNQQANNTAPVQRPVTDQRPADNQNRASRDADATENSADNEPKSEEPEEQAPQRRGLFGGVLARQAATSVEVMWAQPSNQTAVIQLFGLIEAQQTVTITATSAADVIGLSATEGDLVTAGSSLVTMSSPNTSELLQQRQAALLELDATIRNQQRQNQNDQAALEVEEELLRIAKNSVDRFASLSNQQLTSSDAYEGALINYQSQLLSVQARQLAIDQHDDTMQQLQAQRTQLQSQTRQAQQLVDDLSVLAPFDGRLAKVFVKQGQKVESGIELVEIYNANTLALSVRVPLRYRLDQLELSSLSATDSLGNAWQVTAVRPINESGAQRLTLTPLFRGDIETLPGTHVSLNLSYPVTDASAVAIPTTAVYDQQRVYVFNDGVIEPVDVEVLGRTNNGYVVRADSFIKPTPIITTRIKNPVTGMAVSVSEPSQRQREGADS